MRHEFTSGQWVDIRPVQDLKAKDKDAWDAAIQLNIGLDENGQINTDDVPIGLYLMNMRRNALLGRLLRDWSFTDEDGTKLKLPAWTHEGVVNEESIGEIPIDDFNELEELIKPYIAKVDRKPDPKGTTTATSNGSSRVRQTVRRRG